jgi:hypothetical protein
VWPPGIGRPPVTIRSAPGPVISGLMVRHSSSSRPAPASCASRCGPPSQETRWRPRSASASTAAFISTLASPATITSAFRAAAASRRPGMADEVVMMIVRACGKVPAISALSRSRSSSRVTTAIGGDGGRPSRSQAQRTPSDSGRTGA